MIFGQTGRIVNGSLPFLLEHRVGNLMESRDYGRIEGRGKDVDKQGRAEESQYRQFLFFFFVYLFIYFFFLREEEREKGRVSQVCRARDFQRGY